MRRRFAACALFSMAVFGLLYTVFYGAPFFRSRRCGNHHGLIRKYHMMLCRRCFRDNAAAIGFTKVRFGCVRIWRLSSYYRGVALAVSLNPHTRRRFRGVNILLRTHKCHPLVAGVPGGKGSAWS